jgi:hypothetical protein
MLLLTMFEKGEIPKLFEEKICINENNAKKIEHCQTPKLIGKSLEKARQLGFYVGMENKNVVSPIDICKNDTKYFFDMANIVYTFVEQIVVNEK